MSQQLCKVTPATYDLGSIWNFGETWKTMFITIFQNFNSFNFIIWKILLLPWKHFKLGHEHKMIYNSLSTTSNSLRFFETHYIYVFYIYSEFQLYWWWSQRVITFKRNGLQNQSWNFRYFDLSRYTSKWHEISLTYIVLYYLKDPNAIE